MPDTLRSSFPFFQSGTAYTQDKQDTSSPIYLDSAATTQKPAVVLNAIERYHLYFNANVHRGGYAIAQKATNEYEGARKCVADFINAQSADEVVFTSGTTESINMIANGLDKAQLSGNTILIAQSEHHANLVPWQQLAIKLNLHIEVLALAEDAKFDDKTLANWLKMITPDTAIIAVAHVSNTLGNIYPIHLLCQQAAAVGALSIIDGTQAAAHEKIDVQAIACDFYAISGHKMYASTGIGCLYGKAERLLALHSSKFGGEMVKTVRWDTSEFQLPPLKFEGGTPNISGALSLAVAANFIQSNREYIANHEQDLYQYLCAEINKVPSVKCIGNTDSHSIATLSFIVDSMHVFDVASALTHANIAVRAGHHCTMPLMQSLNIEGTVRVSIACYNNRADIDCFIKALRNIDKPALAGETLDENTPTITDDSADMALLSLQSRLENAKNWNDKHRQLLLLSKALPLLPYEERTDTNYLVGCEAKVWITLHMQGQTAQLLAYSDSKVVRGLLTVLLGKTNHLLQQNKSELSDIGCHLQVFLHDLGLPHYFSSGRKDGIQAVIKRIEALVSVNTRASIKL